MQFKVGDRVKCTFEFSIYHNFVGSVIKVEDQGSFGIVVSVKFDNDPFTFTHSYSNWNITRHQCLVLIEDDDCSPTLKNICVARV